MRLGGLSLLAAQLVLSAPPLAARPLHIVHITADDLGWNDLGFAQAVPAVSLTPAIDALRAGGLELTSYYTWHVCGPSRAAVLTGRYPFRQGVYTNLDINSAGVPTNHSLLPQHLKALPLGSAPPYAAHAVGKWHLGWRTAAHTPTFRGFDSFVGYWQADEDYYNHCLPLRRGPPANRTDHFCQPQRPPFAAPPADTLDFSNATGAFAPPAPAWGAQGVYSSELLQAEAGRLIAAHAAAHAAPASPASSPRPLYLYLAMQSVHGPVEAPMRFVEKYNATVADPQRRVFSGMLSALDEAVGGVVRSLQHAGMWQDTLLLFHSDNGGPLDQANNWPLRGGKHTLWEGGTRVRCFFGGPALARARNGAVGGSWNGLAHATDILPTLVAAATAAAAAAANAADGAEGAGGPARAGAGAGGAAAGIDGVSLWPAMLANATSPRTEVVHQIVNRWNHARCNSTAQVNCGGALRSGRHKLLVGYPGDARWQPLPASAAALGPALRGDGCNLTSGEGCPCRDTGYCLFDIASDPLEQRDLSATEPALLATMVARFEQLSAEMGTQGVHFCAAQTAADALAKAAVTNRTGAFLPFATTQVPWLNNISAAPCY